MDTVQTPADPGLARGRRLFAGAALASATLCLLAISVTPTAQGARNPATVHAAAAGGIAKKRPHKPRPKVKAKAKAPTRRPGALVPKVAVRAVAPAVTSLAGLPSSVDLRQYAVAVGDQGAIGSCVTWAIDYAMLGWYSRHDGKAGQPFQPMYTFSQIQQDNGTGSYAIDALKVAKTQGNDTSAHYHTQNLLDFTSQPTSADRTNAANYRVADYVVEFAGRTGGGTNGIAKIQAALAMGKPVSIGMRLRPGFYIRNATTEAAATDDDVTGADKGGHEVLALGYDQTGLWIQNSWGTSYGLKGYSRLSWRVVAKDVYEAYTITGFASPTNPVVEPRGDVTAPSMGPVTKQFALGHVATSTTVPVTVSWSASDASGISAYAVFVKTDGGQFFQQTAIPSTATQSTWSLATGHTYEVAVAARDGAGNWSTYSRSGPITPGLTDDSQFSVGTPWATYSLAAALNGTYLGTSAPGAWVRKTFTGTDAAAIVVMGPTTGRATVYCDDRPTIVDFTASANSTARVNAVCHFAQAGQHTITLVNEATLSRPWLALDAFATL